MTELESSMTLSNSLKSNNVSDIDEEFTDDVLPPMVQDIAVPLELNSIFPWHRPRKQFIREKQWATLADRLIAKVVGTPALPPQLDGRHEVKYLTLPGLDYLDVEMVAEQAMARDCVLTSIGFLEGSVGHAASARAEMRHESLIKAGTISNRSYTFNRRIQEITSPSSPAYRELANKGPYHVINLDACGSIALPGADPNNRMINVIHTLLEYQFAHYNGAWLLFVTTDARRENLDEGAVTRLNAVIKSNSDELDDFRTEAYELFGNPDLEFDDALHQFVESGLNSFMIAFTLGLGKWVLSLAREAGWQMKMHSAFCYSTTPEGDQRATMPCLAFEFIPPRPNLVDPHEVVQVPAVRQADYSANALRVIQKVRGIVDLDDRLAADDDLRQTLLMETKRRLERIGYTQAALQRLS